MIRVRAPSRLHFGLLDPTRQSGRRFGGVGLMIESPGIELSVEHSPQWRFEGPLAERAERLVREGIGGEWRALSPSHVRIHFAAPEHQGLGTGTQLALGLAKALEAWGRPLAPAADVAKQTARGRRSAIGLHGFRLGGFLVDGGKREDEPLAPLVARLPFPETWRVVLVLPRDQQGMHGTAEARAFEQLPGESREVVGERCRLVLMELLPSLDRADFAGFAEGLHRFNHLAGEAFRSVQGGPYAGPTVSERVEFLRSKGVAGIGQSSWGPTVFAMAADEPAALRIAEKLRKRFAQTDEVLITAANNHGASVWKE